MHLDAYLTLKGAKLEYLAKQLGMKQSKHILKHLEATVLLMPSN